jgi:amidophosphoribosyltransferase
VFGIYSNGPNNVALTYLGIQALQTRGQTAAGIAVFNGDQLYIGKGTGLVTEAIQGFQLQTLMHESNGPTVIGQDRYATSGKDNVRSAQPFGGKSERFALGHNGHISGIFEKAKQLGYNPYGCENDSECLTFLIDEFTAARGDLVEALHLVLPNLGGAYSLVLNEPNRLIGVRDPNGYRPLSIGTLQDGGTVLASETHALDAVGADFLRDVNPGEVVIIDEDGIHSEQLAAKVDERFCMFEYIYFAHPNSILRGRSVYAIRQQLGRFLAMDHPVDADMVIGIQNSGAIYAKGYSQQSGIPEELAITKNPYSIRTFIHGDPVTRAEAVRLKHSPNRALINGQRLIINDDSIVRATTAKALVANVRQMGAKEVHLRIPSPPYAFPCYYGMDTHDPNQLIAYNMSVPEICEYIGADSLEYLSLERTIEAINSVPSSDEATKYGAKLCVSCMTGEYPTEVPITLSGHSKARVVPA